MRLLRSFHNKVKRILFDTGARAVGGRPAILDVGCGVGGDISKYRTCGARYVLGVDVDPEAIAEARRRLMRTRTPVDIRFVHLNSVYDLELSAPKSFDVVSCQFCMHYLWVDPDAFLGFVRRCLRDSGVFIATIMNGDVLRSRGSIASPYCTALLGPDEDTVEMHMEGTRYFDGNPKREKVMYPEDVIGKFLDAGFSLLSWNGFKEYQDRDYPEELSKVSELYCSVMFRLRPCTCPEAPSSS